MKNLYKQKREQGFTIIEVMIVLAIAAVILLIVLLAVPALQRNSRNTQRANDAGKLAAAVNTCLANQNGVVANCASTGTNAVDIDTTTLSQLSTVTYINGSAPTSGATDAAVVTYGYKCTSASAWAAGSSKQFVITYKYETTGADAQKCVGG